MNRISKFRAKPINLSFKYDDGEEGKVEWVYGYYSQKTLEWLEKVKKDFFVGVISNNHNPKYIEKVSSCTDFPIVFEAHKPDIKVAKAFMEKHNLSPSTTCFVGDRPLTDVLCGKKLGCKTIMVDSITADTENLLVRFVRWLEKLSVKKF